MEASYLDMGSPSLFFVFLNPLYLLESSETRCSFVSQPFKGKEKATPWMAFGGDEGMLTGFIFRFAKNSGCGAPAAIAQ
ncbi:MAG: hypothetical protein IJ044_02930, partial [Oscillospiraceae bacterium]|nr:hypothetical protein [Oscillospiraceae bacterium]